MNRELTIIRLNPDTESGFPLRIQRNFQDLYGNETKRKRIKFRTSDRFLEFANALKIISIIPNCHTVAGNSPTYLVVDLDPWYNVTYDEMLERLQDYCRYLHNEFLEKGYQRDYAMPIL